MKILYIHGFGSQYDNNSQKVQTLNKIGSVIGYNVDYTVDYNVWFPKLVSFAKLNEVDYVVGCSMGGFTASKLSESLSIPFVALNPVLDPKVSLKKYAGNGTTYFGNDYNLQDSVIESYPEFSDCADGLILLEEGDTVIDAHITEIKMKDLYNVLMLSGGSHRFDQLEKCINIMIENYVHFETRN
jgi:predicted esterase YcpF (UPF0227 family)